MGFFDDITDDITGLAGAEPEPVATDDSGSGVEASIGSVTGAFVDQVASDLESAAGYAGSAATYVADQIYDGDGDDQHLNLGLAWESSERDDQGNLTVHHGSLLGMSTDTSVKADGETNAGASIGPVEVIHGHGSTDAAGVHHTDISVLPGVVDGVSSAYDSAVETLSNTSIHLGSDIAEPAVFSDVPAPDDALPTDDPNLGLGPEEHTAYTMEELSGVVDEGDTSYVID